MLRSIAVVSLAALSACAVGPNYKRPTTPTPPAFKEADGWAPAAPADMLDRGPWWTLFEDDDLNKLEADVAANNQNLAAQLAAYRQAHALVAEARAAFFPTVTAGFAANDSSGHSGLSGKTAVVRSYAPSVGATWAPDLWGKVRRQVEAARATAQADWASAQNVRLSMQTELATDYLQMRAIDEELRLYAKTVEGYKTVLTVSQNQYAAGTVGRSAVLTAQAQLFDAEATTRTLHEQRQQLEHAIAVLSGRPPAELTLEPKPFTLKTPEVPAGVPSALLQRRPDIAAAERQVRASNAQIGVQIAAFFPNVTLNASYGFSGNTLSNIFNASNKTWSFGSNSVETLFEGGQRFAAVSAARAAHDQSVAQYRQTVLTALQQVEDELIALKMLEQAAQLARQSSAAADEAEQIAVNQFRAGTVSSTDVVVAEQTALSERRAVITYQEERLVAIVSLIEALGGGWNASDLDKR